MIHTVRVIRFEIFFGLLVTVLWIYCLVDVISRDRGDVRNLGKVWWIVLVLLFPLAGSVAWLVAGRPRGAARRSAHERAVPEFPEYDRSGRAATADPEADAEFLRRVRERAEEQRRQYREQQRGSQPGDEAPPAERA